MEYSSENVHILKVNKGSEGKFRKKEKKIESQ